MSNTPASRVSNKEQAQGTNGDSKASTFSQMKLIGECGLDALPRSVPN